LSTFALTRVCVWFSTEHGDDNDNSDDDGDYDDDFGLGEGGDGDKDEGSDDIGDDEYEDEEPFIDCYLSFFKVRCKLKKKKKLLFILIWLFKPPMGVLLITARATEKSFTVRSIAHSRDNQIPMDRTAEMEWKCQSLYFGKVCNFVISTVFTSSGRLGQGARRELAPKHQ
jgi:hypothetical protein